MMRSLKKCTLLLDTPLDEGSKQIYLHALLDLGGVLHERKRNPLYHATFEEIDYRIAPPFS
ncbi:MAG TPA: hypothetical protein VGN34_12115, partial [Ktedonobacteraceae bacterium]